MVEGVRRRPVLAVIGDGGPIPEEVLGQAHALGRLAIDAGFRLVTGGRDGVMDAASRGARASERWQEGDVIAILPGYDRAEATAAADVVIPTGLGQARNAVIVATADVVVAVGGGPGTLSEMALAAKLGRPVIALEGTGGWAAKLAGQTLGKVRVVGARTPEEAIAHARRAVPV